MLAKLASARNKPNKQTIVTLRATDEMLASLPMRSIRGLGGKLGESVESLLTTAFNVGPGGPGGGGRGSSYEGGFTAATLSKLTHEALTSAGFEPNTVAWLTRVSRGEDAEPVTPNACDGVKSINAFKSFQPLTDRRRVHSWLSALSSELTARLIEDRATQRRTPRSLKLEYRANHFRESDMQSKSLRFPAAATAALERAEKAEKAAATSAVATSASATSVSGGAVDPDAAR